ncbi:MAG: hypothetical protein R2706_17015 [Acidimicrobiales bacterium]
MATLLPSALDQTITLPGTAQRHLEQCLRCQADAAHYRRIRSTMRASRSATYRPDAMLLGDILRDARPPAPMYTLGRSSPRREGRRALVGWLAALATASAAGILVLAARPGTRQGLAT